MRYNVFMATITARQRVLAFLRRRPSANASQIGHALNMSAATIRHHLSILAADGRVVASGVEATGKRGRPDKTYRLSDRLLGENFDLLADMMLVTWLQALSLPKREAAVRAVAERLAAQIGKIDLNQAPVKRLVQLTEKLNGMHYQARWEAGAQGPRIVLGRCPYAAIIAKHPELCRMDAFILGSELDAPVEQLSKIDPAPGGATHCIFAVREQQAASPEAD
jgi:predicted ArsR family transcriptional regulator